MAIIRVVRTSGYTVLSNTHINDRRLTLKAKGLMTLMLSLPEGWDFSVKGLCVLSNDGKSATSSALAELEACRYLVREQNRDGGKFAGYDYTLYEEPQEAETADSPFTENRETEKPLTEKPLTENRETAPPTPPVKEYNIIKQLLTNKSEARAPAHEESQSDEVAPYALTEALLPYEDAPCAIQRIMLKDAAEANHKPRGASRFVPPTLEEVKAYIQSRGSSVDPQAWFDHYEANGWMVGKTRMKNWQAAVRTWERNGIKPPGKAADKPKSYMTDDQWADFYNAAIHKSIRDDEES